MSRILYTGRQTRKSRKKSFRLKVVVFVVVIAMFLGAGVVLWAFKNPRWQITKIEIGGNKVLSADEIKAVIQRDLTGEYDFLIPKSSFFLVRPSSLVKDIKKEFPRVRTIEFVRVFPDTLNATVSERSLWGIACNDLPKEKKIAPDAPPAECVFLDTTGFAMERSPSSSGALVKKIRVDEETPMHPGEELLAPALMQEMDELDLRAQSIGLEAPVAFEYSFKTSRELHLVLPGGMRIFFKRGDNSENTFRVLKTVFEKLGSRRDSILYIDVRFGNKVFYKFKNGQEVAPQ